jgi:thioredoxin-related protein
MHLILTIVWNENVLEKCFMIALILGALAGVVIGQSAKPRTAKEIMDSAYNEAQISNKNIFIVFHASWCGWCKRLERVLETPEVKVILEKNYIITRLDVLEREEKITELENSGGKEIMSKYGGEKSGLPFYAVIDHDGKQLANSNCMPDSSNIGFPGSAEELEAFISILKKTSKSISESEFDLIVDTIKKNLPPPKKQN